MFQNKKIEGYFHQTIKFVSMDMIGSKCVWKSSCGWSTRSVLSWESYSNFHMWTGVKNFRPESGLKFFIHEIGLNFLSGMFNLVPHVKFLICIHFKHVSGVNQVWNRPDLMRIFCTGSKLLVCKTYRRFWMFHQSSSLQCKNCTLFV